MLRSDAEFDMLDHLRMGRFSDPRAGTGRGILISYKVIQFAVI